MSMEIWDLYDEQGQKTGEIWERSRAREILSENQRFEGIDLK